MESPKETQPSDTEIVFFVRLPDGTEIPIKIDRNATIRELKNRIDTAGSIPPGPKQLSSGDKKLRSYVTGKARRLSAYNIKNRSTVIESPGNLADAAGYKYKYADAIGSGPSKLRPADTDSLASPGAPVDTAGYKSKREAQAIVGEPTKLRSADPDRSAASFTPTDARSYRSKSIDAVGYKSKGEAQATAGDYNGDLYDYDEDLYIVDPQSHFGSFKQLEQDVLRRSEYFKTKRSYSVSSVIESLDDHGAVLDELGLEFSLPKRIYRFFMASKDEKPLYEMHRNLHKTYSIMLDVSKSLKQMVSLPFCIKAISILLVHPRTEIVEIKRIPLYLITRMETSLKEAVNQTLGNPHERSFRAILRSLIRDPIQMVLEFAGYHGISINISTRALLALVRKTALLLDIAIVSYARSHGSGFDINQFGHDLKDLDVNGGDEEMAFRCFWVRLACLDFFLDRQKDEQSPQPKSLLTRMKDLAGIWGPVYTVRPGAGLVKCYRVSKGVICRVEPRKETSFDGAINCHYFSRRSFFRRKASKLLFGGDELEFAENALLLIGARFRENRNCQYTRSAFIDDVGSEMSMLGTKESVWKTESRSLALGLSRYVGITFTGTPKLIPQSTLKQHILDKWTTMPSRSNPGILNQYLGIEISHCMGNARRISLKELLISDPIWQFLDRQIPNWDQTSWGSALSAALRSAETDAIFRVWREHAANRSEIAELFSYALNLLDGTGWDEQGQFHSAFILDNAEYAVSIPPKLNSWVEALKDTHLTGAYVITNEICIECEVPHHTTSTCEDPQSLTVLETQLAATASPVYSRTSSIGLGRKRIRAARHATEVEFDAALDASVQAAYDDFPLSTRREYLLKPFGERFQQGSSDILLLTNNTSFLQNIPRLLNCTKAERPYECSEALIRTNSKSSGSTVHLAASTRSVHGKHAVQDMAGGAKLSRSLKWMQHTFGTDRQPDSKSRTAGKAVERTRLCDKPPQHHEIPPIRRKTTPDPSHTTRRSKKLEASACDRHDLIRSDIYGQDGYYFGNGDSGDDEMPKAIVPTVTSVRDNLADYAFSDDYDSDEATSQPCRCHEMKAQGSS
ncbi:MAG: hypothetical protein Q9173_001972 [Seirophora scorigena]